MQKQENSQMFAIYLDLAWMMHDVAQTSIGLRTNSGQQGDRPAFQMSESRKR